MGKPGVAVKLPRRKNLLARPERPVKEPFPGVLAVAGTSVLAFRKRKSIGDHSLEDIRMDCSKEGDPTLLPTNVGGDVWLASVAC